MLLFFGNGKITGVRCPLALNGLMCVTEVHFYVFSFKVVYVFKYMRLHIIIIFHDYIVCIKKSTPEKNIVVVHIVGESFFERTRALFCSCVFLVMLKLSISLKYFLSAHFLAHHHVHEL